MISPDTFLRPIYAGNAFATVKTNDAKKCITIRPTSFEPCESSGGTATIEKGERKELTSGSTWHAAGLLPLFNMSYSVGQLHKYAVNLYKTLEEETGKNVGFSVVSNIRLASTKDRMDEYHQYAGVAQTIGVDVKFLSPEQVKEIWPLCHTDDLFGAIQHPEDGYIQPADLTQALATGARNRGGMPKKVFQLF